MMDESTKATLEDNRFLLQMLLDNIPDSIYFKDRDSRFVRISQSMARKFSFSDRNYVIGKSDADIFTREHAEQALSDEQEIMLTGQPVVARVERETWPDRQDTWCSTTKMPLLDESGQVVGTFGISRDITELKRTEEMLRHASEAAEQANRAKSDFLANMSHEIRTPMNGIIGMAELLADTHLDSQQSSFVEMIQQSAGSLLRLLNDILDFSKIEAGKLELESVPVDLRQCVGLAVKSLATRASQKGLELIVRVDPAVPEFLYTDPVRLRQILVNLVGNAIKFTDVGEVIVNVQYVCGPPSEPLVTLLFSVRDTGIGIGPAQQGQIFEAFCQADSTTTRKYGGTGLGLSISSQLVHLMGGKLWVESDPMMRPGSEFLFNLKLSIAPAPEGVRPIDRTKLRGLSVLVIDDNETNRMILDETLRRFGMVVTLISGGLEALSLFRSLPGEKIPFDLIIVDRMMPELDGLQLMERIVVEGQKRLPPTIIYSSSGVASDGQRARRIGITEYLQKPALQSELMAAIEKALGTNPTAPSLPPKRKAHQTSRPLRILLAEDGAVNRAVASGLFERAGHELVIVEDGAAAIDAWKSAPFDAIFMDVQMPIMDGIDATKAIREQESGTGQHIPIIAMTAEAMKGDREKFLAVQMNDYLSKPIDFTAFEAILERIATRGYDGRPDHRSPSVSESLSQGVTTTASSGKPSLKPPHPSHESHLPSRTQQLDFAAPFTKLKCSPLQQKNLVETLRVETRQRLDELIYGIEKNDLQLVIRAAHSLKSAAGLFGAKSLVSVASKLEQAARDGDRELVSVLFPTFRESIQQIQAEIDRWLSQV